MKRQNSTISPHVPICKVQAYQYLLFVPTLSLKFFFWWIIFPKNVSVYASNKEELFSFWNETTLPWSYPMKFKILYWYNLILNLILLFMVVLVSCCLFCFYFSVLLYLNQDPMSTHTVWYASWIPVPFWHLFVEETEWDVPVLWT